MSAAPARPDGARPPTTAELRMRVAEADAELHKSIEELTRILGRVTDWKQVVRDHPVQSSLAAGVLGFVLASQPRLVSRMGMDGLRGLAGLQGETLLNFFAQKLHEDKPGS